jgi:plasmid stabilization system protein ParE
MTLRIDEGVQKALSAQYVWVESKFGVSAKQHFEKKVVAMLLRLLRFPNLGRPVSGGFRLAVITRHVGLMYTVESECVAVVGVVMFQAESARN